MVRPRGPPRVGRRGAQPEGHREQHAGEDRCAHEDRRRTRDGCLAAEDDDQARAQRLAEGGSKGVVAKGGVVAVGGCAVGHQGLLAHDRVLSCSSSQFTLHFTQQKTTLSCILERTGFFILDFLHQLQIFLILILMFSPFLILILFTKENR